MAANEPLRRTKIVATLGPASDADLILRSLIRAGMSVARLNLSHGDFDEHAERVRRVRAAAAAEDSHVAVMVDTRGIEIRTGKLESGPVELKAGQRFMLYTDGRRGNAEGVSVSYKRLPQEVEKGSTVLLDDAAIEMHVVAVYEDSVECEVDYGGKLAERKGVNLPGTRLSISAVSPEFLSELEKEVQFAADNEADYLAASFVQSGEEIDQIRELMEQRGHVIPIIAKIENRAGVDKLDAIVEAADGIMVARGDLGVELPLAEVPGTQKKLIRCTVMNGKPVITATQMLASMEASPRPTRAEASDVANAILDGTSAVMLSGETAIGKYPVEAVKTMSAIALRAESSLKEYGYLQTIKRTESARIADAVGQAAARMAEQLGAKAILTLTGSGFTARLISRHRPECIILAVTASRRVARRLALNWGVIPLLYGEGKDWDDGAVTSYGCERARALGYLETGDTVVVTHGTRPGSGGTDLIRVVIV